MTILIVSSFGTVMVLTPHHSTSIYSIHFKFVRNPDFLYVVTKNISKKIFVKVINIDSNVLSLIITALLFFKYMNLKFEYCGTTYARSRFTSSYYYSPPLRSENWVLQYDNKYSSTSPDEALKPITVQKTKTNEKKSEFVSLFWEGSSLSP